VFMDFLVALFDPPPWNRPQPAVSPARPPRPQKRLRQR
jgi:hypothetical protein